MKKFEIIYRAEGDICCFSQEALNENHAREIFKHPSPNCEVLGVVGENGLIPTFEQAEAIVKERMRDEWKKCASHPQCDYASVMFYTGDGEKFSWNLGVKIIGQEIKGYGETFEQAWAAMPTSESIKAARIATLERELAELKGK